MFISFLQGFSQELYSQDKESLSDWAEFGIPTIQNFDPDDYGANPMNWGMVQDNRGILYVANLSGILEFDGVTWRKIDVPKNAWVLSIARDSSGTIYAGLFGDFGYLAPDSLGKMQFISLLKYLNPDDQDFAEIWRIHATRAGVYFRSRDRIFLWTGNKIKVFRTETQFSLTAVLDDTLYVEVTGSGLLKTGADSLVLIPDSKRLQGMKFLAILPYDHKYKLVCTAAKGLLLFDGNKFYPFTSPINAILKKHTLSSAVALPERRFAVSTYQGGAFILNHQGRIQQILNKDTGLPDNDIKNMYADPRGNLWMSLNSGISLVQIGAPFTFFTEKQGLQGNVVSIIRHQGTLYAATSQSIYYLEPALSEINPTANNSKINIPIFKQVKGITTQGFWLISAGDWLLAGTTNRGVYSIIKDRAYKIDSEQESAFVLARSIIDTNRIYVGLKNGIEVLQLKNQKWVGSGRVKGVNEEIRTIVEEENGTIWLGSVFQGVLSVNLTSHTNDGWSARVRRYGRPDGLPDGPVNIFSINWQVVFATTKGHRRYNKFDDHFYPDSSLSPQLADTNISAAWIDQDQFGQIFVWPAIAQDKSELWMAQSPEEKPVNFEKQLFRPLNTFGIIHKTYTDNDSIIWIGCSSGLVRYDSRVPPRFSMEYPVLIRQISTIPGDSVIFQGYFSNYRKMLVLPYDYNALRFQYAMPYFEHISQNKYQYMLDGFDSHWSNWTAETRKDYTNLGHGLYNFRVRAKNIYGRISDEAIFRFEILPPWYLSKWSYIIYFIIFIAGIYAAQRYMHAHLIRREKKHAELREAEIISYKNKELQEKNEELGQILSRLQTAQNSLIESESRFRSVAESANDAIITADKTGNILFWNKRAEAIFGYSKKEAMGKPLTILMPERHRKAHLQGLNRFYTTGEVKIMGQVVNLEAVKKSGEEFPIELTLAAWEAHDGEYVTGIVRDITKRKQEEEALRDAQAQLFQSEKLSTLGKLSAGIAHELNNPVASVKRSSVQLRKAFIALQRAYLKMSKFDFSENQISELVEIAQVARDVSENPIPMEASIRSDREQEIEQWLDANSISNAWELAPPLGSLGYTPQKLVTVVQKFPAPQFSSVIIWQCSIYTIYSLLFEIDLGTSRIADISMAFKSYTYMDQAPIQNVDIEQDLENTLIIFKSKLKDKITVLREFEANLPKIEAYGSELNQVWTNIIVNAVDAMGEKGILSVRTKNEGSCVVVEIEDNGPGIPEKIQSKIFDPFFTTKKVGTGSGLGLSLSHNIVVKKHDGQLSFNSKPGKTTFIVRLPVTIKREGKELSA